MIKIRIETQKIFSLYTCFERICLMVWERWAPVGRRERRGQRAEIWASLHGCGWSSFFLHSIFANLPTCKNPFVTPHQYFGVIPRPGENLSCLVHMFAAEVTQGDLLPSSSSSHPEMGLFCHVFSVTFFTLCTLCWRFHRLHGPECGCRGAVQQS